MDVEQLCGVPSQDTLQQDVITEQHKYDIEEVIHTEHPQSVIDAVLQTPESSLTDTDLLQQSSRSAKGSLNTSHNSYTVAYKISVLDWYHANGENKAHTSKHFSVDRKRIRDWLTMEDYLRSMPVANRMRRKNFAQDGKAFGKRPPGSEELDHAVLDWYKEQKALGTMVYSRQLRAKALELSPQCGLPETFKASSMWLQRWKKRHAADIKEADGTEEGGIDDVHTVTLSPDFEEHLRQLEQVSAHLTDGHDDSLVLVSNEVSAGQTGLQISQNHEISTISQNSSSMSESGLTGTINGTISPENTSETQPTTVNDDSLQAKIREQDHWIDVAEQTLESLEVEVNRKIGQAKLVIQQLKTGQDYLKQQLREASISSPQTPSRAVKRHSTPAVSTRQTKRARKT